MMKQKTTGHRRIPSRLLGVSLLLAGMSLVPVSGPVWAREGATAATFGLVDEAPHTFLRPKQVSLPEQSSFRSVHAFRPHSPGRSRSACPLLCGNIPPLRLNIYSGEPLPSSFDIPAKSDYSLLNTPLILLSCRNMLALYKNNVSVISYVSIISPIVPE